MAQHFFKKYNIITDPKQSLSLSLSLIKLPISTTKKQGDRPSSQQKNPWYQNWFIKKPETLSMWQSRNSTTLFILQVHNILVLTLT